MIFYRAYFEAIQLAGFTEAEAKRYFSYRRVA